jgi:hypothetical protein
LLLRDTHDASHAIIAISGMSRENALRVQTRKGSKISTQKEQDTRAKRTKNTGTLVCGRLPRGGFSGRRLLFTAPTREFTEGISILGSPQLPAVRTCRRFCCRRSHRLVALQPTFKHHELSLGERHELPLEPRRWLWGPGLPIAAFGRRSVGSCRWAAWQGEPAPVRQHDGT